MSASKGIGTIDFGADPGTDEAKVVISGQAGLITTTHIEAFVMHGDSTVDNDASSHEQLADLGVWGCKWTVDGSFEARCTLIRMLASGTFKFHFVWSN